MADARQYYNHSSPYTLRGGGQLPSFELAYETWGTRSTEDDNIVLICTGLSPDAHAASGNGDETPGWWEFMIGPGKPIDTHVHFVICINSLGSCKGSTGPASIDPRTGNVYATSFPELAIEDIAHSQLLLLQSLNITSIDCLVGPSMGGMVALSVMKQSPGLARRCISISSACSAAPFSIALRSLQRNLVTDDPDWHYGQYRQFDKLPETGMRNARKLGLISYRSAAEWQDRFGRERIETPAITPFSPRFQIESYLSLHAERFASSFDPNCYLYLSRAMDEFQLGDSNSSLLKALHPQALDQALVIGVDSDILFPVAHQRELRTVFSQLGALVTYHELDSAQGHDAFLVDQATFATSVATFMADSQRLSSV